MALGKAEPGNDSAPQARLVSVRVYPRSAGLHRVVVPIKGFTFPVRFSACTSCPEMNRQTSNVRVFFITLRFLLFSCGKGRQKETKQCPHFCNYCTTY